MKKLFAIALLPFFLYACTIEVDDIGIGDANVRAVETETSDFPSADIQKVEISTENGSIETDVWNDDTIDITFEKWATGYDEEDAIENIRDVEIHVDKDTHSGVLNIEIDFPKGIGINYGCSVSLSLPAHLVMDLKSSNGAIEVSDSQSGFKCHTSNGAITTRNTAGDAELRTSNGKIAVRNHHGELNGRTSNGALDIDIVLPMQGECILKTSNGSATLSIPEETSAMLEASTSNGQVKMQSLDIAVTRMEKTEIKGRLGSGQGYIDIETSNGSVLIRQR